MEEPSPERPEPTHDGWHQVSIALLVGLLSLSTAVFLVTLSRVPIGPPVETAPLFVWNATAAAVALALAVQRHRLARATSVLAGLLVVTSMVNIATSGAIDAGSSPLGPLSYVAMAVTLIGVAVASWRRDRTGADQPADGVQG